MNDRQRFQAIMHYQPFDRGFIQDFQYWNETIEAWHHYGLPEDANYHTAQDFFGFDRLWEHAGAELLLCPGFDYKVIEEDAEYITVRRGDGVITRNRKTLGTIPHEIDHVLKDRSSWEKEFKWRLDPSNPDRIPSTLDEKLAASPDSTRTFPLMTGAAGFFGYLRNWMGLEGISYLQYDDPKLLEEMIATLGDCIVGTLGRVLAKAKAAGVTFDLASMWEDMAYGHGPLMNLQSFIDLCIPQYQRISSLLRQHGCDLIMLDCDGDPNLLYPHWVKAGVNIAFPMEVGTWDNEPIKARKVYGKEMRIMGGFSKRILAQTPADIDREIDRLAPLVEEGGFIPFCDHRVPPDVSLSNYIHYVIRAKQVWGKGLPNLRPTGTPNTKAPMYGKPYDHRIILGDGPAAH